MKKLIALLLAAVMLIGLCACDAGQKSGTYKIGVYKNRSCVYYFTRRSGGTFG